MLNSEFFLNSALKKLWGALKIYGVISTVGFFERCALPKNSVYQFQLYFLHGTISWKKYCRNNGTYQISSTNFTKHFLLPFDFEFHLFQGFEWKEIGIKRSNNNVQSQYQFICPHISLYMVHSKPTTARSLVSTFLLLFSTT